jgi:hypothetical protein
MKTSILFLLLIWCFSVTMVSQNETLRHAYVDKKGVLRWSDDQSEIHCFGVNYTVPFAHAYRMAGRLGISPEEAIRQDVYHFARLDLDLYRVHVWDTEISDSVGNLLENEHLRLFDFTINEMKKRGMHFIITPIAFWGNGWPEPDEKTPGFSYKYRKEACLTNPGAIEAQANYLIQFMEHVNPYTGVAYKDDPDVIAFEVSNEPHHNQSEEEVTAYINKMTGAIRNTGTPKPIFYNMSHSIHLADAYFDANVQGGTFQWYPSGLVAGHALKGNYLQHVNAYKISFADNPGFQSKAKVVYEFDPGDVAGNYMYPAMARSFREAGMQTATQFAYDAMFLAPYNTNYGTHYMNLAYAPQKALSLKIASAVFHEIPRYANFGDYPSNNTFGNFRVDYEQDLAELVSGDCFFYTNNTHSKPSSAKKLKEIAGYGSSPVVKYEGKGAYFLDEVENGIWRLEVMPDAYWLSDPYAPVSPAKRVAAVNHAPHSMMLNLPQLGSSFSVEGINDENTYKTTALNGAFEISPGVYILKRNGIKKKINPGSRFKNIMLSEYIAPASNLDTIVIENQTFATASVGDSIVFDFNVISAKAPKEVMVFLNNEPFHGKLRADMVSFGHYKAVTTGKSAVPATVHYHIAVCSDKGEWVTFPGGLSGKPDEWDFYSNRTYHLNILSREAPVLLWSAEDSWDKTLSTWNKGVQLRPAFDGKLLSCKIEPDSSGHESYKPLYAFKYYFGDDIAGRRIYASQKKFLLVNGKATGDAPVTIKVSLIDKSGFVQTTVIRLNNKDDVYKVPLKSMVKGQFAIIPLPYPGFLPYYSKQVKQDEFSLEQIETLQIVTPGSTERKNLGEFWLNKVWLE